MTCDPITSWQIEGGKVEVVTGFLFLVSKITAYVDCSHEIRRLLLGRKIMTNLDRVFKSRDDADKSPYSWGYFLPSGHVQLREVDCKEGRVTKNGCLWTVVLEKTPESLLDSKEINPEYSPERLMLKLQYFGHLMWTNNLESPWCWERLRAEGEEGVRGWDGWMAPPMQWTWTWANFRTWWGTGKPSRLQSMGSQSVRHNWVTEQQKQWQSHNPW